LGLNANPLRELVLRPNPLLEISHYRIDQFLNLFSLFKKAKKNVEDDFRAAGEITQVEMKMRLLNAKKPLTKAAEKVKKLNEMQSIVDLLNYWTEIGGSRRRSKRITVRILGQDDERVIEEIAQYHEIHVRRLR
jgi:hypothetical protein